MGRGTRPRSTAIFCFNSSNFEWSIKYPQVQDTSLCGPSTTPNRSLRIQRGHLLKRICPHFMYQSYWISQRGQAHGRGLYGLLYYVTPLESISYALLLDSCSDKITVNRAILPSMKICPRCKVNKDKDGYYFQGAAADHLSHFCRLCQLELMKQNRKKKSGH